MKKVFNFANIAEKKYSNFKDSKVVIMQVPYDNTSTYRKGAKFGPAAIIEASAHIEQFDEELNKETYTIGIHTQRPLKVARLSPKKMVKHVEKEILTIIDKDKFPVTLGGEHSVAIGAIRAISKQTEKLSVLQLDAHCDLRDEYMGSRYNHACFARRIIEFAPIVQAGVRSLSKEEKDFLPHPKIRIIDAYEIYKNKDWIKKVCDTLSENVYVTIDMDVFDPSVVPATGTPEPGGIGWYEAITLLKALSKTKTIVGFDVMELCPVPGSEASHFLAAKLIYRFLGYIYADKAKK